MRDSADSYDPALGRFPDRPRTNRKRQRNRSDDEETFAKRQRHVERLASEETAADATDGLAPGERWSTWDQSTLLYEARVPVPYPVQITGTEVLLEFIGEADGTAAPRLAETRPDDGELADLWDQLVEALVALARRGYAHGDLSPYNLLVRSATLVMIDLPQVVDVIAHPNGRGFLERDATNVARWFAARGLQAADPEKLAGLLVEEARLALHVSSRGRKGGQRPREAC